MEKKILLGITGATGMLYVPAFLEHCKRQNIEVHGIISDAGKQVLKLELQLEYIQLSHVSRWFDQDNFAAPPASGSTSYDGMVVLPCTMGSLAAIASGFCNNLIHRAADVNLKEGRVVVLGVRETPLNRTHLKNMLQAHDAGAVICPLMPAFYNKPSGFREMAHNYTGRICDLLGFDGHTYSRWIGEE